MNYNIRKGKSEFKQHNYKKALSHFKKVEKDDKDFEYAVTYKIKCLMELKRFNEALVIINHLAEKYPDDELLIFDKIACHIFLNEDAEALSTLRHAESIIDSQDKYRLVQLARYYNLLNDSERALIFCNRALDIDRDFREALYEKSIVAMDLEDYEMLNRLADQLMEISEGELPQILSVFILKLFSKRYRDCIDLIDKEFRSPEDIEMMKAGLYNKISDDLNAEILLSQKIELSVDDALKLILDYAENGRDNGSVHGVQYFIV